MRNWILTSLCLLLGLAGQVAAASSDQFYFVGQAAPLGSLSSPGQRGQAVYLRWDVVEGRLPADLARIRLERDGSELLNVPADAVMSAAEIASLYQGAAQERRLLESLSWLRAQAAQEQPPVDLTQANFAEQVRQRLQDQPYWAFLASRVDFNIARARYRGYLDTAASSGVHTYILYGVDDNGTQVRLGRTQVDTTVRQSVSAAAGFEQILLGHCDAPESGKDHGAVALSWDHGGRTATDRYANSLLIAGYDVYRSTSPLGPATQAPSLDIAALAAGNGHDQGGAPQLPGLERVNEQPIMISGRPDDAHYAQFMQTAEELSAAGLEPGDRRAYYLVPRDFTGNYGPTVAAVVEVPDLRAPAAPWAVEVETEDASDRFSLVWDAVNLLNYHRSHQDGRTFCNLDTARAEGRLRYVPAGKQCGSDAEVEVNLNIDSYRVYRFGSYQAAAAFKDSDGDGVADDLERTATPSDADRSYSCDAGQTPSNLPNHLLPVEDGYSFDPRQLPSGRRQVVFDDAYPGQHKGEVVWYRVASVSPSGLVSELTPPVRGHFPDRSLPSRPELGRDVNLTVPDDCGYGVEPVESKDGSMALDHTGAARNVSLSCAGYSDTVPLQPTEHGSTATPTQTQCGELLSACQGQDVVRLDFLDDSGSALAGRAVSLGVFDACPTFYQRQDLTRQCRSDRKVEPGEALEQPPRLAVSTSQCVAVYREIDGKDYKIDTVCGANADVDYGAATLGQGEPVCLSVAAQNDNARSSARTRLPCFSLVTSNDKPAGPQPLELSFNGNQAQVAWQLPEERVAATVLEWYRPDHSSRRTKLVSHPGARGGKPRQDQVALTVAPSGSSWQEQWCVRARVVGQAAGADQSEVLSDWSAPLCALRLPQGQDPGEYLAWPEIPRPPRGEPVPSVYLNGDQVPVLLVSDPVSFAGQCDISPPTCDPAGSGQCLAQEQYFTCPGGTIPDPVCGPLRQATGSRLGFVAYRQSRPLGGGPATDFVQVSPLIDNFYCATERKSDSIGTRLHDPYIKLVRFGSSQGAQWQGGRLIFVDRYPHVAGREYRYQFVYFSDDGEIQETRTSQQWLTVPQ